MARAIFAGRVVHVRYREDQLREGGKFADEGKSDEKDGGKDEDGKTEKIKDTSTSTGDDGEDRWGEGYDAKAINKKLASVETSKAADATIETTTVIGRKGGVTFSRRGTKDAVLLQDADGKMVGTIVTHNHPGGYVSLSNMDVAMAISQNVKEIRVISRDATGQKYLTRCTRDKKWGVDAKEVSDAYLRVHHDDAWNKAYFKGMKERGKSYEFALQHHATAVWKEVAPRFGLTITTTRWRGRG